MSGLGLLESFRGPLDFGYGGFRNSWQLLVSLWGRGLEAWGQVLWVRDPGKVLRSFEEFLFGFGTISSYRGLRV